MIVDIHTHVGEYPLHISAGFAAESKRLWPTVRLGRSLDDHARETAEADRVIVLGFQAHHAGWVIPNDYVADYVHQHADRLIGFGSVDPTRAGAVDEVGRMRDELGLMGCKLAPIYQGISPLDPRFLAVLAELERRDMPVVIHQGATFLREGPLIHARPILLDEVARTFPRLRLVIAHMGHPWCDEAIVVIRKHPNLYADISALCPRPLQLFSALSSAVEYGVSHKLLFGSDWPFFSISETVDALRNVNTVIEGTGMPRVPEDIVEGIIHRPSLDLLNLDD